MKKIIRLTESELVKIVNDVISSQQNKNYIIGDSQTPFIDMNSSKASRINNKSGVESLWKSGMGLSWLKTAVEQYPVSKDVNAIIINIGTNDGFNLKDDVTGLVGAVRKKFPNAKLFAVQGSWGWGNNSKISEEKVRAYYSKFENVGVTLIYPPIGKVKDPHGNLPIYKEIGKEIDKEI